MIACPSCPGAGVVYYWQQFADGRRHIRADCNRCHRYIKFAPKRPPYTDLADANSGPGAAGPSTGPAEGENAAQRGG
jgi:hypothetical protein